MTKKRNSKESPKLRLHRQVAIVILAAVVIIGVFIVFRLFPTSSSHTIGQQSSYGAGTYLVGDVLPANGNYNIKGKIPAGEYRLIATDINGYLEISPDGRGDVTNMIGNDNFTDSDIVAVHNGEYLVFRDAVAYPLLQSRKVNISTFVTSKYAKGMLKAGLDISAGTYAVVGSPPGEVTVSSDSRHTGDDFISVNTVDNTSPMSVTVASGQYLELSNAHILPK